MTLETEVADDVPLMDVDPVRIREVLGNLVANALRHTPAGGRVAVRAGVRPGRDQSRSRSRDTGSGIDPELLPHVFDRFARGAGSSGTGLGLSIARSLVDLHGGSIEARSPTDGGTRSGSGFRSPRAPSDPGREPLAPWYPRTPARPSGCAQTPSAVTLVACSDDPAPLVDPSRPPRWPRPRSCVLTAMPAAAAGLSGQGRALPQLRGDGRGHPGGGGRPSRHRPGLQHRQELSGPRHLGRQDQRQRRDRRGRARGPVRRPPPRPRAPDRRAGAVPAPHARRTATATDTPDHEPRRTAARSGSSSRSTPTASSTT